MELHLNHESSFDSSALLRMLASESLRLSWTNFISVSSISISYPWQKFPSLLQGVGGRKMRRMHLWTWIHIHMETMSTFYPVVCVLCPNTYYPEIGPHGCSKLSSIKVVSCQLLFRVTDSPYKFLSRETWLSAQSSPTTRTNWELLHWSDPSRLCVGICNFRFRAGGGVLSRWKVEDGR